MSTPLSAETFTPLDDTDPATPGDPLTRLRYHYGQLLGAEDFTTEQRYFLLRRRLHNAMLHGLGTVWGLRVAAVETADPAGLQLHCEPGVAVDALGREVFVPERVCLDVTALAGTPFWADLSPPPAPAADGPAGDGAGDGGETAARRVYVVLSYRACLTEQAPAVVPPCTDADAALVHSRVRDGYRLCLQAEPPPDPAPTQRDAGARPDPRGPRERLLDLVLNPPVDPARFWSGADDAPLLLAVVDLEPVGDPVERVRLIGAVDNGARAILPHVQGVAALALGVRFDGAPGAAGFQVTGVSAAPGEGGDAGRTVVTAATTAEAQQSSLTAQSVRVLRFEAGAGWTEPGVTARTTRPDAIEITVDEDWTDAVQYQVCLLGTGDQAIVDRDGRLLAGVAGEAVPTGSGRDVYLSATYIPAP